MRGKVFGHKKSIILCVSAFVMLFFFLSSSIMAFLVLNKPILWFYNFCLALGIYQLLRAILFFVDDALYLGSLLSSLGLIGYLQAFLPLERFSATLTLSCFALSSLITFLFYKQNFHLILAYFFIFVTIFTFLHAKNLISFEISIAFVVCFLVIFILSILLSMLWRK